LTINVLIQIVIPSTGDATEDSCPESQVYCEERQGLPLDVAGEGLGVDSKTKPDQVMPVEGPEP